MIPFRSLSLVLVLAVMAGEPRVQEPPSGDPPSLPGRSPAGKEVKIGLLIPDQEALAAVHGAALAVREANQAGGNLYFKLVVRSTDGMWGRGSKESVGLVFEDEVVAMMGSLDGRNAHLAEQVATKTRVAFLSAWATDMTLSQAFVPWYFRCLPNDRQQARSLAQEIYGNRNFRQVALITTDTYDSRNAAHSFARVTETLDAPAPETFECTRKNNLPEMLASFEKHGTEAIVLFTGPEMAGKIKAMLVEHGMNQMIFGTLAVTDGQAAASPDWSCLEGSILVSSGHWFTERGIAFQQAFRKTYGYLPGAAAAYAYDGINVIIGAARKAGTDRDRIIEGIHETNHKSGITGEIQFDMNGNRTDSAILMTVRNGIPLVWRGH